MTVVDTTHLAQDQTPYKPQRRMSATTISTSAMSTGSSTRSDPSKPDLALPADPSNSLMRMLAKDVVSSLMKDDLYGDDMSAGGSLCSNMSRLNLDLEHIADLVLAQVEKQHKGSDHELRKFLRDGLADGEYASDVDCHDEAARYCDERSGHTRASAAMSHLTTSTVSDISMATGDVKDTVDIYHPDFWGGATTEGPSTDDVGTRATNSTRSTSQSVHTILSSDAEQATMHSRSSLHDLIQKVNEASSESDSDPTDSFSVLSDISGLTGCFDDDEPSGHHSRSNEIEEVPQPPPFPSRVSSSSPSVEGSIVGSMVQSKASSKKSSKCKVDSGIHTTTRKVSFGSVHVRHYERIMSDNPSSTNGPSVGIGWEFVKKRPKEIDEFEKTRKGRRKSELMLSRAQREKIIKSLGYTDREIAAMVRESNKLRFQRRQTVNNLSAAKLEETLELAKRQVLKALFLKKKQLNY